MKLSRGEAILVCLTAFLGGLTAFIFWAQTFFTIALGLMGAVGLLYLCTDSEAGRKR